MSQSIDTLHSVQGSIIEPEEIRKCVCTCFYLQGDLSIGTPRTFHAFVIISFLES